MELMQEVTRPYYFDPTKPETSGYYVINQLRDGRYTWEWSEPSERPCFPNETYGTISEALEAAANDWDDNGSGSGLSFVLGQAAGAYRRGER